MKSIKCIFLLLLMAVSFGLHAQESQFIKVSSWESLLSKAKKEGKLVLIDSYFIGCIPCKEMDDEVFPLENVKVFMEKNFVNAKINFMTEELGKQLQIKYGVTGFPTFLILNGDGQLISRFLGYKDADQFLKLLSEAMDKSANGLVLAGFSPELNVLYPDFYTEMFKARKSMNPIEVAAYMDKNKEVMKEGHALPFLLTKHINPYWNSYFLENYAQWEQAFGKELIAIKRNVVIKEGMKAIGTSRDDARFASFLKEVQPKIVLKDWPNVKLNAAEHYYLNLHKDAKAFFQFALENANDDENKLVYLSSHLNGPKVDAEEKRLFCEWMKQVVSAGSGYEMLTIATRLMLAQNDLEQAKRYAKWGLNKSVLLQKDGSYFQGVLALKK